MNRIFGKRKKSSVSDGALGTLAVFPKFKICILSTANQDQFLDDLKVMLPMSVNRFDIDIATAEISKPSLIGFDVGESASYSLGFL